MLYAMQNSMTPYDYADATTSWGGSVLYIGCADNFSNCHNLTSDAGDCCDVGDYWGSYLDGNCCASCTLMRQTQECGGEGLDDGSDDYTRDVSGEDSGDDS